jgi:hypothetical protein
MPGLVPGIHVFGFRKSNKTWMAGTSPAMTVRETIWKLLRQLVGFQPCRHNVRRLTWENEMDSQLFAAIRRGKVKPGMADEFAKRVKAGALPVMQKMDGFKGYYLVIGADDTVIAVSLFSNKVVAEGSTQKLMPWIKDNLGPLLASPTESVEGQVVVSALN